MVKAKLQRIYEGKAKILFQGASSDTLIQHFKDTATAFNDQKRGIINGKGILNNSISSTLMKHLEGIGIPTHFIRWLNIREQLVHRVEIIPIEVVVRNIAAGTFVKRFDIEEGTVLPRSIIEYYYKSDSLSDPMVTEEHITAFEWASLDELEEILSLTLRINDYLLGLFLGVGLKLVDFKLEFGRFWKEDEILIFLADEISPDTCRLWDVETNKKYDKDRFRENLGNVEQAYQEVAHRLKVLPESFKK